MIHRHRRGKGRITLDGVPMEHADPDFKTIEIEWTCKMKSCSQVMTHWGPLPRSWLNAEDERKIMEILSMPLLSPH